MSPSCHPEQPHLTRGFVQPATHGGSCSATTTSAGRRATLVSLAFNCGLGGFLGLQKMLATLEARDYWKTAQELLDPKCRRPGSFDGRANDCLAVTQRALPQW